MGALLSEGGVVLLLALAVEGEGGAGLAVEAAAVLHAATRSTSPGF